MCAGNVIITIDVFLSLQTAFALFLFSSPVSCKKDMCSQDVVCEY